MIFWLAANHAADEKDAYDMVNQYWRIGLVLSIIQFVLGISLFVYYMIDGFCGESFFMPHALLFLDLYFGVTFILFIFLSCTDSGKHLNNIKFKSSTKDIVFRKMLRRFYTWTHYLFWLKVSVFLIAFVVPDGMGAVSCSENGYRIIFEDVDGHIMIAGYMCGSILVVFIAIKQVFWDAVYKQPKYRCAFCVRIFWPGSKGHCYFYSQDKYMQDKAVS
jgi:hypothetical protein